MPESRLKDPIVPQRKKRDYPQDMQLIYSYRAPAGMADAAREAVERALKELGIQNPKVTDTTDQAELVQKIQRMPTSNEQIFDNLEVDGEFEDCTSYEEAEDRAFELIRRTPVSREFQAAQSEELDKLIDEGREAIGGATGDDVIRSRVYGLDLEDVEDAADIEDSEPDPFA